MSNTIHNCELKKCAGNKYCGLKLECHRCNVFSFIECIEKTNEIACLLKCLEIYEFDEDDDIHVSDYCSNNTMKLNSIFDGPLIQFICDKCNSKVRPNFYSPKINANAPPFHPNVNSQRGGSGRTGNKSGIAQSQNNNDSDKKDEGSPEITQQMKNIKKNAGIYEIFISKFDKNMSCENITDQICKSIVGINENTFSVKKIGGTRKFHKYSSFKVSTVAYNICHDILNMNWDPHKAEIFSNRNLSLPRRNNQNHPPHSSSNDRYDNRPSKGRWQNNAYRRNNHRDYRDNDNRYGYQNQRSNRKRKDYQGRYNVGNREGHHRDTLDELFDIFRQTLNDYIQRR